MTTQKFGFVKSLIKIKMVTNSNFKKRKFFNLKIPKRENSDESKNKNSARRKF